MTTPEDALVAREMISKLVALAREAGDEAKLAMALHAQGHAHLLEGELALSAHAFDESRELSLRLSDKRGAAITLAMLGFLAVLADDLEQGLPLVASALSDLEAADPARAAVAVRLAEASRKIEAKRFDAALKAATRGKDATVHEELSRAVESVRAK